jgi:hypothetical protein
MKPFGVHPTKPTAPDATRQPDIVDAGVEVIVKRIHTDFAARGLGDPSREEIHAIALAWTTASTAALHAAIEAAIELRAASK